MSEFDDPELARRLGRVSGPYPDENAGFAAMQTRLARARRRRAAMWSTGAGSILLIVTVVGAVALRGGKAQHPQGSTVSVPASTTSTTIESVNSLVPISTPDTTATGSVPESSVTIETGPETSDVGPGGGDGGQGGGGPETTEDQTTQSGGEDGHTSTTSSGGGTQSTIADTGPRTFSCTGGSMVVRISNGRLVLLSYTPNAGYTATVLELTSDSVKVDFQGGDDWRLRVRIADDGTLVSELQHDD